MAQAAFDRTARLRNPGDFRVVFAHGQRFVCDGFVLIAAPGAHSRARLGCALAKRRIPRAVDRNRIKRVLRESFRHHRDRLDRLDVVVLARSDTRRMTNASLFAQLADQWQRMAESRRTRVKRPPADGSGAPT